MNTKKVMKKEQIIQIITDLCDQHQRQIQELKHAIDLLQLENKMLRETSAYRDEDASESSFGMITILLYITDNREGMETEECVGVFPSMRKALEAQLEYGRTKRYPLHELQIRETTIPSRDVTGACVRDVWVLFKTTECYGEEYHEYISTTVDEPSPDLHEYVEYVKVT
jgi:hypothetical protein